MLNEKQSENSHMASHEKSADLVASKFLKPYNPQETEPKIYKMWEESGFFNPDNLPERHKEKYSIVMPPPNVTGVLHMGHALMITIEDIMIRYQRMRGKRALWLPGTDHAAIATQSKVEKDIKKNEDKSRYDLGREELLKRIDIFAKQSHDIITSQIRTFGASCDWSREAFTLDEKRNLAVRTIFKKMYDDGLIYRGNRIINWDPKGQTTISDDEIVYEERPAKFYTFKYSKDFPISISTTRPETKVGDTAVAVHPEDIRYQKYIGKEYDAIFCGVPIHIKIIADKSVEKEFGTGALGVTPAHSMIDWEMGIKNNLPVIQVINEKARMMIGDERILDKKVTEAREIIVEWLKSEGLLEKEEDIKQNVSTAERTGGIIEPLPKLQWFVAVNKPFKIENSEINGIKAGQETTLKEIMRNAVEKGQINILPDYFNKTYFHWIDKLGDWCISRQIWYGHRIPVWYDDKQNIILPKIINIFFGRHGECVANLDKIIKTQKETNDSPLTDKGISDAKSLGESLRDRKITKIICSNLSRSQKTADIVAKVIGFDKKNIEIWPELKEIQMGDSLAGQEQTDKFNTIEYSTKSSDSESLDEIEKRAKRVIEKIKKFDDKENVLIVGHNGFNSVTSSVCHGFSKNDFIENRKRMGRTPNGGFYTLELLVDPVDVNLKQDEDTLDTWFSSALWTFSTLGWPEKTKDLAFYHPTDVLETGYEILFFWVARMIMMTGYSIGTIPFKTVYLHGTVRDAKGRKMSKSLNNGIDPLDIAAKFGADAGRMALTIGNTPGTDSKMAEDKIKGYKNFANKIWNITRFILESTKDTKYNKDFEVFTEVDKKLIKERVNFVTDITSDMEEFRFYMAGEKIYHYTWHTLADIILEDSKQIFKEGTEIEKESRGQFLLSTLRTILVVLHPFMPFVTEEIWQSINDDKSILMIEKWPM